MIWSWKSQHFMKKNYALAADNQPRVLGHLVQYTFIMFIQQKKSSDHCLWGWQRSLIIDFRGPCLMLLSNRKKYLLTNSHPTFIDLALTLFQGCMVIMVSHPPIYKPAERAEQNLKIEDLFQGGKFKIKRETA